MLKQAIIKDKKIVGALLLLVAAIATFVIACAIIFAQPTVEQSWASSQQTEQAVNQGYDYMKKYIPLEDTSARYNFTIDLGKKAEDSSNPVE